MELREMIQTYWSAALAEQRRSAAKDGTMLKPREPTEADLRRFIQEADRLLKDCYQALRGSQDGLRLEIEDWRDRIREKGIGVEC